MKFWSCDVRQGIPSTHAGNDDSSQDNAPKSGRTSPAPPYLKSARRSGKVGPSRNASGTDTSIEAQVTLQAGCSARVTHHAPIWAENSHPSHSVAGRGTEHDNFLQLLPSYLRMRTSAPHVWRATMQVSHNTLYSTIRPALHFSCVQHTCLIVMRSPCRHGVLCSAQGGTSEYCVRSQHSGSCFVLMQRTPRSGQRVGITSIWLASMSGWNASRPAPSATLQWALRRSSETEYSVRCLLRQQQQYIATPNCQLSMLCLRRQQLHWLEV